MVDTKNNKHFTLKLSGINQYLTQSYNSIWIIQTFFTKKIFFFINILKNLNDVSKSIIPFKSNDKFKNPYFSIITL